MVGFIGEVFKGVVDVGGGVGGDGHGGGGEGDAVVG